MVKGRDVQLIFSLTAIFVIGWVIYLFLLRYLTLLFIALEAGGFEIAGEEEIIVMLHLIPWIITPTYVIFLFVVLLYLLRRKKRYPPIWR
jgi:hypothetical protein